MTLQPIRPAERHCFGGPESDEDKRAPAPRQVIPQLGNREQVWGHP